MKRFAFTFLFLFFFIHPQVIHATTRTLSPSDDVYVSGHRDGINNNYQAYTTLRLSNRPQEYFLVLVRFPLSGLPADKPLRSAKFRLYFRQTIGEPVLNSTTFNLNPITSPWSQNTVAWFNRPNRGATFASADTPFSVVNQAPGYQEWDITSLVNSWLDQSLTNYGFYLEPSSDVGGSVFDSAEGEYPPQLILDFQSFTLPSFVQPVIKFIPGLALPTPLASPQPTGVGGSPSPTASPTAAPASPTTSPTGRRFPTPFASPQPSGGGGSPTLFASPQPSGGGGSPSPFTSPQPSGGGGSSAPIDFLVLALIGLILLCLIGSLFLIYLLKRKPRPYAQTRRRKRTSRSR